MAEIFEDAHDIFHNDYIQKGKLTVGDYHANLYNMFNEDLKEKNGIR